MKTSEVPKSYEFPSDLSGCRNEIFSAGDSRVIFRIIENADGVPYRIIPEEDGEKPENSIIIAGTGITELFGVLPYDFTEQVYRNMVEKIIPLDNNIPPETEEARNKLISGKIENFRAELLIKMPDGRKKRILEFATPVYDTGKVKEICGIFFDPGKWKTPSAAVKYLDLSQGEDVLKKAFLNNISHEIRTPLNAIIGFSTILCDPECNPAMREEYAGIILRSADTLLETVNNIIEASLLETGAVKIRKELTNLNSLIKSVYNRLKDRAGEKGIIISYSLPIEDEHASVITDRGKVVQVLENLGSNAIKFTTGDEVELGYVITGKFAEFYVYDNGKGIPENCRESIFSSFYQVDDGPSRMHGGTGLGLFISRFYVEMLGGKIWYFSEPGAGTTFYFTIPFEKIQTLQKSDI